MSAERPPGRRVFTEQDVLRLAREGGRELVLGPEDRLTALARDTARDKGIAVVVGERSPGPLPAGFPGAVGPQSAPVPRSAPPGGGAEPRITHVREIGRLALDPFPADIGRPEMDVRARDVVTSRDGLPLAAGMVSLRAGSFPWHLDYDEIEYVLEGELHITTATQQVVGLPGDVIAVPKGSSITFGTPSWAKFFYVTYPADWAPA